MTNQTDSGSDTVLERQEHVLDMERVEWELTDITQPYPSVKRVFGKVLTNHPRGWCLPNVAVRLEVGGHTHGRPVTRIYTVRSFDPESRIAEMDFVLHGDDSPAMAWLGSARPGDRVWMTGPREHFVPTPVEGRRVALFADDTAIPAIFAILQSWPQDAAAEIWIETDDTQAFAALPELSGVTLHRLPKNVEEPTLFTTAQQVITDGTTWTVWAAGERDEMRSIRAHCKKLNMDRNTLQITGYWRKGETSTEADLQRLANYQKAVEQGLSIEEMQDSEAAV